MTAQKEMSEQELKKQNKLFEEWLKKKPPQKQPSDILNEMFNPENKTGEKR